MHSLPNPSNFLGANVTPSHLDAPELPSTTQALAYVALRRGIQNYTCASSTAAPVAIGAVATLFDATSLAYSSENILHTIPPIAVYLPLPLSSFISAGGILKPLGKHYFDINGTPTFDLYSVGKILFGAKTGDIKAPTTANKGPAGTGAVDWLQLTSKTGYKSVGLQTVYRVVTAGGVAPACTAASVGVVTTVHYAAEYCTSLLSYSSLLTPVGRLLTLIFLGFYN